ncbi:PH domain-containing protein [Microbacterium sp. CFBP9034]|uniref:PH domain-containing protein n=1 Tax=Microbacterium sp. CFBP9034 TaxID=3096540 RepID=UPI002A6ACEAC|nr:PH domain-containing protein [Microbacterium sp. CFBP9034]MDY0909931.1 PH domain-containing protein [Microbacterium sp. CFBP9034]
MSLLDPRIERHLIADQGEVVIDEVRKHWAAIVGASLELFAGTVVLLLAFFARQAWWLPLILGGAIVLHAWWRILEQRMDRLVITNMRVFRVHGILSQRIATMPLSRILDVSVHKPIVGRMVGFGHFVFESAAQEQGLREVRFVGDPDERGLTIQRVIQQAGLRGFVAQQPLPLSQAPVRMPPRPPLPAPDWRDSQDYPTAPVPPFHPDRTTTAPIDLPR